MSLQAERRDFFTAFCAALVANGCTWIDTRAGRHHQLFDESLEHLRRSGVVVPWLVENLITGHYDAFDTALLDLQYYDITRVYVHGDITSVELALQPQRAQDILTTRWAPEHLPALLEATRAFAEAQQAVRSPS